MIVWCGWRSGADCPAPAPHLLGCRSLSTPPPQRPRPTYNAEVATIGIDYGGRRIGIAVSESNVLATPYAVIGNDGDEGQVVERIAAIGEELRAELYIVGLPRRTRSRDGEQKYLALAERLRQRTCKAVELWDETLSTVEAAERLRATGRNAKKAKSDIDMHAAAVILQSYLDRAERRTS